MCSDLNLAGRILRTRLEEIPLFVKDGAIIPMLNATQGADQSKTGPLEVRHYGTKENQYLLYNDDGESYDFENGAYSLTELSVERKENVCFRKIRDVPNLKRVLYLFILPIRLLHLQLF